MIKPHKTAQNPAQMRAFIRDKNHFKMMDKVQRYKTIRRYCKRKPEKKHKLRYFIQNVSPLMIRHKIVTMIFSMEQNGKKPFIQMSYDGKLHVRNVQSINDYYVRKYKMNIDGKMFFCSISVYMFLKRNKIAKTMDTLKTVF
jgi:hypothetical protein